MQDYGSDFDVSVFGLGAMGTIVARTLAEKGKRVAAWNRSPGKAESLQGTGIHVYDTPEDALQASQVSIFVMLDMNAATQTLSALRASDVLKGRTIVNYSSGSPEECQEMYDLVTAAGGRYINGVIMAYPRNIGSPESYCIHLGDPGAFADHQQLLELLAGHAILLPATEFYAFAAAVNAQTFSTMFSFFEVAGTAHRMGLPIRQMARQINNASRFFAADAIEDAIRRFEGSDFEGDQATVDVHAEGFAYIQEYMHSQGAWSPIFDAVCEVARKAQQEGHGQEDIAATTKVFTAEDDFSSSE
jgi:3-hydroxyisobutyrate dehydrogenase-like beta-hydroxyacid dehydrogenase